MLKQLLALLLLVFILSGCFNLQPAKPTDEKNQNNAGQQNISENDSAKFSGQVLAGNKSLLLDFNANDYQQALSSKKIIVLYFYANWCPICKAEFPKMQAAFNQLDNEEIIGFRINFNDNQTDKTEQELARQFGVAYQHTKVILKDGDRVLKSPESWEQSRYLKELENINNQ